MRTLGIEVVMNGLKLSLYIETELVIIITENLTCQKKAFVLRPFIALLE